MPQGIPAEFDEYREVCYLGFAKINARWQLAVSDQIEMVFGTGLLRGIS
jgi:hypothetical protein